jgi:hypothetical protein
MKRFFSTVVITTLFVACHNGGADPISESDVAETVPLTYEVELKCIENPAFIGEFMGVNIAEGGFSGLTFIPGTEWEFFAVTDRGPNTSLGKFLGEKGGMLFPFPDYAQKIVRLKWSAEELQVIAVHPIFGEDGEPICGFPAERSRAEGAETAFIDLKGTQPDSRSWKFDLEGITLDANGDFWLADEYRPAVLHVDGKSFKIKQIYSAEKDERAIVKMIDSDFAKRQPNRGFEGVAITPDGNVLAILQSPLNSPELHDSIPNRLIRILHLNPETGETKVFGYEASEGVHDPKIGDLVAVNEYEFLIIEHGKDSLGKVARIIRIDLEYATDISEIHFNLGTSFEALKNNAKAQYQGLILAQKTEVLDLIAAGFNPEFGKPEGLTIIDASTLAVVNDNDFGIERIDEKGKLMLNHQPSCIYKIEFNQPIFDLKK